MVASSPYLPVEIVEQIIEDVSISDLPTCAIIRSDFLAPCRELLFSKVVLEDIIAYKKFRRAVTNNPTLGLIVKELSIKESCMFPKTRYVVKRSSLAHVLNSFQNLTRFTLEFFRPCNYERLSGAMKKALLAIFCLPSLEHLKLLGIVNLPPESTIIMLSIPAVELSEIDFRTTNSGWHLTLDEERNKGLVTYKIETIIIGFLSVTECIPLIDVMSFPGVKLAKIDITTVSGDYESNIKTARKIIRRQRNSVTALWLPPFILNDDELDLLDISIIRGLQSIRVFAQFDIGGAFDEAIYILSKANDDNHIEKIIVVFEYEKLEGLSDPDSLNHWEEFDELLSGPNFQRLRIVEFQLNTDYFKDEIPGGAVDLKNVIKMLLPVLDGNGKLDLAAIQEK